MHHKSDNKNWIINKRRISDKYFRCNDGSYIHEALVNDLFGDCGPEAEDEPILAALLEYGHHFSCNDPSQLHCREGHSRCFTVADICKYKIDERGFLFPCRNGGHLENCKDYQCSSHYKCSRSYCIPWSYVCNGQWDCPEGYDEEISNICHQQNACKTMYKCKSTHSMCIHLNDICDYHYDCPFHDDEFFCELHHIKCPFECYCLLFGIECYQNQNQFFIFRLPIYFYIF